VASEIDRIIDQLQRAHDGDPWHGSPVMAILDGVTAEQAAAAPPNGAHSIWELVLHMTAWRREAAARAGGAPAGEPPFGDWPAVEATTPDAWRRALDDLGAAHRELLDAVRRLPEADLFAPTVDPRNRPLGTGVTRYELLHGIAQHDAYHAGQAAIVKRVLGF
jgi:uncharacterized damage-inducible protein DinB